VNWLSDSKLVAWIASCWNCDAADARIWLLDVERGTAQSLTDGLERWTFSRPSPDSKRILVGGKRLRLFSADGDLVRDYGAPPEGYIFAGAVWSTDGSAFSYILRPESYPIGP
jgi:Tol biopolymer transport system component